jgi:hypothetical protein
MKYYNPVTKKIVFGWSLHHLITKVARNINFSIRFLIEEGGALVYSLNTKVHSITIAPALQADFTEVDVETVSNYFLDAINNSTSADSSASIPTFDDPGTDLDTDLTDFNDNLLQDDVYVLEVQAVAPDQGVLEYQPWTYVALNGTKTTKEGTIVYKTATYDEDKAEDTKYYLLNEGSNPVAYKVSTDPAADKEDGKQLYERYWTC